MEMPGLCPGLGAYLPGVGPDAVAATGRDRPGRPASVVLGCEVLLAGQPEGGPPVQACEEWPISAGLVQCAAQKPQWWWAAKLLCTLGLGCLQRQPLLIAGWLGELRPWPSDDLEDEEGVNIRWVAPCGLSSVG